MDSSSDTQGGDGGDTAERGESLRRTAYLTIAMGIVHAVLFLSAYWLLKTAPGAKASNAEIEAFYQSTEHRSLIVAGLYLMPFAGIAFIWFMVALRSWLAGYVEWENVLLSNVEFVTGILYVALFFATAAASAALGASVQFSDATIDPVAARLFPQFGSALLFVFAMRMAAMFVFTTSNIGGKAGVLPRWFVYLSIVVGLFLLLSATFSSVLVLVFPLWLLALCALIFRQARRI